MRELTEDVDLCLPSGRLNPAAVGWSRHPVHRPNLRGWGRGKRWEYWCVTTPHHVVAMTVASLDYAGLHTLWLLDLDTLTERTWSHLTPLARGIELPARAGKGRAYARGGGLTVRIDETPAASLLRAEAPGCVVDLAVPRVAGRESLGVVVPWSEKRFQYTVKDVGRPASGQVELDGRTYLLDPADARATLDHGRGRWPARIAWNWGAGTGSVDGRDVALQVGGKWTAGTGATENALFVAGRAEVQTDELEWRYDLARPLEPWRVTGRRLDLVFTPVFDRVDDTSLGPIYSHTHQCFGHWSGSATTAAGERLELAGLLGWAEDVRQSW